MVTTLINFFRYFVAGILHSFLEEYKNYQITLLAINKIIIIALICKVRKSYSNNFLYAADFSYFLIALSVDILILIDEKLALIKDTELSLII
jgi:hypothetical protein